MFLMIDKWKDAAVHGSITFYMKGSTEGEKLATLVLNAISKETNQTKRSANPGDYFVLRESIAPAVIVECGFLSNPDDVRLLQDAEYQGKLANGIVAGVTEYFLVAEPTAPPVSPMWLGE